MGSRVQLVDSAYNAVGKSVVSKTITYAAGTTGAIGTTNLFQVTGVVNLQFIIVCNSSLTETGATAAMKFGVTGGLDYFAIFNAVSATTDNITSDITGAFDLVGYMVGTNTVSFIVKDRYITQNISVQTVSGGSLTYYIFWEPISSGAKVVAL